jgi:uncharacterized membrane protein
MSVTKILLTYFFTSLVFFIIDIIWLGVIAKNLYAKYLGEFLSDQVNWTAAIIFYLIFIAGILIFAIYPAIEKSSLTYAIIYGLLFGFFTYATYDLTNYATLKGWPLNIVFIDIIWGTLLSGMVSVSGFYIGSYIKTF